MKKDEKKSEEQILFPEAKVGNITIVPWSFGKLFDVSESLEEVLDEIDSKNLTNIFEGDFISYVSMARLFTIASDQLLKIIAITLYKDEENEFNLDESIKKVRKFDMSDGIKIASVIAKQNWETIKNVLGPLLGEETTDKIKKENPKEQKE